MNESAQPGPEPRCSRCGGELLEEDSGGPLQPLGILLVAAGVFAFPLWPYAPKTQAAWAACAALVVMGLALLPTRTRWRCTSCKAVYGRRLPPRQADAKRYDSAPDDSADSADADDSD